MGAIVGSIIDIFKYLTDLFQYGEATAFNRQAKRQLERYFSQKSWEKVSIEQITRDITLHRGEERRLREFVTELGGTCTEDGDQVERCSIPSRRESPSRWPKVAIAVIVLAAGGYLVYVLYRDPLPCPDLRTETAASYSHLSAEEINRCFPIKNP